MIRQFYEVDPLGSPPIAGQSFCLLPIVLDRDRAPTYSSIKGMAQSLKPLFHGWHRDQGAGMCR